MMTTKQMPPPGRGGTHEPSAGFYHGAARPPRFVYVAGPDKQRRIGSIYQRREGLTFSKTVHRGKHLHRALNAWALQVSVLDQLRAAGVAIIEVKDAETGAVYRTTLERLESEAIRRDYPPHGPQLFLPLHRWSTAPPAQARLPFGQAVLR